MQKSYTIEEDIDGFDLLLRTDLSCGNDIALYREHLNPMILNFYGNILSL